MTRGTMNFDSFEAQRIYSDRSVDENWRVWCRQYLAPANKDVVDIGCGGGIYSRGFISLGARTVTGVDSSAQYLEEARLASPSEAKLSFALGSATASGLPDACANIVFQRAVIHHLTERDQWAEVFTPVVLSPWVLERSPGNENMGFMIEPPAFFIFDWVCSNSLL